MITITTPTTNRRWTVKVDLTRCAVLKSLEDLQYIIGPGQFQVLDGTRREVKTIYTTLRAAEVLLGFLGVTAENLYDDLLASMPAAFTHRVFTYEVGFQEVRRIANLLGEEPFAVSRWFSNPTITVYAIDTTANGAAKFAQLHPTIKQLSADGAFAEPNTVPRFTHRVRLSNTQLETAAQLNTIVGYGNFMVESGDPWTRIDSILTTASCAERILTICGTMEELTATERMFMPATWTHRVLIGPIMMKLGQIHAQVGANFAVNSWAGNPNDEILVIDTMESEAIVLKSLGADMHRINF